MQKGTKPTGIFEYFNHIEELVQTKGEFNTPEDFLDLKKLERALAVRTAFKVKQTLNLKA